MPSEIARVFIFVDVYYINDYSMLLFRIGGVLGYVVQSLDRWTVEIVHIVRLINVVLHRTTE